jgi:cytochrome P450 family 4
VLTLHRRKDIWGDDADKFDPDNFAAGTKRHPYAYLPFSGGSRICIGYKYANMAMAIVLAHLIRHYKFSTALQMDELTFDFCITLRLINKHMVTAEKRTW